MAINRERTIVILKSPGSVLENVEKYLTSRSWDIYSTDNVKAAIANIFDYSPQYVFVCINHPSIKFKALQNLLTQATNTTIISFCDKSDVLNVSLLREMKCKYELLPPISGPSIERMALKINLEKRAKRKREEFKAETEKGHKKIELVTSQLKENGNSINTFLEYEKTKIQSTLVDFNEWKQKFKNKNKNKSITAAVETSAIPRARKSSYPINTTIIGAGSDFKTDSVLIRGLQYAISSFDLADKSTQSQYEPMINSQKCQCIVIDTESFEGYLLAAFGNNREIDTNMINMIKEKLFDFLKLNGECSNSDLNVIGIEVQNIDFSDWAYEQAEFLRKSIYADAEIGFAFFACDELVPEITRTSDPELLMVSLENIEGNSPLPFSVYLYLPHLSRLVMFVPKGSIFASNQKNRLLEKGIRQVLVKRAEEVLLRSHCTQKYLKDKINEHIYGNQAEVT
jgi:AmiR/NasT family two-component response regulator